MKILIFGSSYIRDLKAFCCNAALKDFDIAGADIEIFGVCGLLLKEADMFLESSPTLAENYDIVVTQMGGNDLEPCKDSHLQVLSAYCAVLKKIWGRFSPGVVIALSLLHRDINYRLPTPAQTTAYNEQVDFFNDKLPKMLAEGKLAGFWSHPRLRANRHFLRADGTHLNEQGVKRHYRSIRGAIIKFRHNLPAAQPPALQPAVVHPVHHAGDS